MKKTNKTENNSSIGVSMPAETKRATFRKVTKYASLLIGMVFLFLGAVLGCRLFVNAHFVAEYQKGVYHENAETAVQFLGTDNYVLYYNLGNAEYQKKSYKAAVKYYGQALECSIPEKKECAVRINYVLADTHTIDFAAIASEYASFEQKQEIDNEALTDKINEAITELKKDRTVLTSAGCANADDSNGHSKEAEALKADIDAKIKELQDMLDKLKEAEEQSNEGESEDDGGSSGEAQEQPDSEQPSDEREEEIQKQLEEQQSDSVQKKEEQQQIQGYFDYGVAGESGSESGFNGKSW